MNVEDVYKNEDQGGEDEAADDVAAWLSVTQNTFATLLLRTWNLGGHP